MADRLPSGFLLLTLVLVPLATVPPWTAWGGPAYAYEFPKLLLLALSMILGWAAILTTLRARPLSYVARFVFLEGIGPWVAVPAVAVVFASLAGSGEAGTTLLGTNERMDGAVPTLFVLHGSQLGSALARLGRADWHRVVDYALAGAVGTAAYIFLQGAGLDPWTLVDGIEAKGHVPAGGLAHPGLASIYLACVFSVALAQLIRLPFRANALRWALLAVVTVGLSIPSGRTGIVAALLAVFALFIATIVWRTPRGAWWKTLLGAVLVLLPLAAVPTVSDVSAERVARFAEVPTGDRSTELRFVTWDIALKAIRAAPLFGSGSGAFASHVWTFATPEQEHLILSTVVPHRLLEVAVQIDGLVVAIDPDSGQLFTQAINYDKAHNYILDLAIQFGLLGAVAFGVLWAASGWRAVHQARVHLGLLVLALCYLASQQFWFATPIIDIGVLTLLGLAFSATPEPPLDQAGSTSGAERS